MKQQQEHVIVHNTVEGVGATKAEALESMIDQILRSVIKTNFKPKSYTIREEPTLLPCRGDEYRYKCKFSFSPNQVNDIDEYYGLTLPEPVIEGK